MTAPTADLPASGPGVDLFFQAPCTLGEVCEMCTEVRAIPMATVSWDDDTQSVGTDSVTVCRGCLVDAWDLARSQRTSDRPVATDMPAWGTQEVADLALATYRKIDWWCRLGLLTPENQGNGSGKGDRYDRKFLADDLAWAKRLSALVHHGLNPQAAHRLLQTNPAVADALVAALDEAPEVAA